jgi:RHS repeat-associated protein
MKRHLTLVLAILLMLVGIGTAQTLVSIQAVPNTLAGYTGEQYSVQVVGTFSDGSQQDISSTVTWSSSNQTIVQAVTAQPQITVSATNGQQVAILTANSGIVGVQPTTVEVTVLPGLDPYAILPPGSGTVNLRGGNIGVPPFSTIQGGPVDSLNVATDNVLLNIPVRVKNEHIPFSFSLVGNSSAVMLAPPNLAYWYVHTGIQGEIGGLLGAQVSVSESIGNYCDGVKGDIWLTNFAILDSTGVSHPVNFGTMDLGVFYWNGTQWVHSYCFPTTKSGGTNDNSGLSLTYTTNGSPTWTVHDLHGNSVANLATTGHTLTDQDNNHMYLTNTSNGYSVVDSEGATVLTVAEQATGNGSQDTYSYIDFNGKTQQYIVTYGAYTQYTQFGCGGIETRGTAGQYFLPHTITIPKMPNDSVAGVYTLGYEATTGGTSGRLASITYPTGGNTTYSYGSTPINCSDNLTVPVLTRTTTDTTSNTVSKWKYSTAGVGTALNESVAVVDPAGNAETYNFNDAYPTELNVGGIIDTYVCYNGTVNTSKSACVTPAAALPSYITQSDAYSSQANGAANTYNHTQTVFGGPGGQNPTSIVKWDLPGGNGISTANNQTSILYTNPKTNVWGINSVQVIDLKNASATDAYQLNYWDSNGHLYEPCSWIAGPLNGQNFKCTIYTFNTNGTVATSYDATGTTFTYHYNGECGSMVPTSVTNNAITTLTTSVSYSADSHCYGGMVTSQIPVNGYGSSQTYGDPLWRMDSSTDAYGSTTSTTYQLNSTTSTKTFSNATGNVSITRVVTLDSLGRVISEQTQNGSTYDTVATRYDVMGRPYFKSWPFSCATKGNCTPGNGTTIIYDAAGREKTVTDGNGGTTTYTYTAGTSGTTVQSVLTPTPSGDQTLNGKQRALMYNGLGQLVTACEVNAYSDAGPCPGSIGVNGYITNYSYNALGNLLRVAQGPAPQVRLFAYNGLRQITQETNPENGVTTYTYGADSAHCTGFVAYVGDLASIYRNSGAFTCFSYDKLHRLITSTQSNGTQAGFTWDSATINGGTAVGQNGKIAEAYTCGASCNTGIVTDEGFTYDKTGMPSWYYQKSPNSGGWYSAGELFDPIGNMIWLGLPSVPGISEGSYDPEGRPSSVDATSGPSPIVSSVTYGFFGALSVTYGNTDSDTFSYYGTGNMASYRFNVGSNYYLGSLTWNQNRTLGSLATTDTIPGNGGGSGTITYHYDDLGRLTAASDGKGDIGQTYSYDRYGNLVTNGSPFSWTPSYNANNQYVAGGSCNGTGICYDGDGNLTSDTFNTYTWSSDDKMLSVNGVPIIRDAFDRVVEGAGFQFLQVPILGSIAQFKGQSLQTAKVPLPGGGSAVYNWFGQTGLIGYNHSDWHGNLRLTSTQARSLFTQNEYTPFGQMYDFGGGCCDPVFDSANSTIVNRGFDMPNRTLHGTQGRWLNPDPAGSRAVDVTNPQTWNRYAYVGNDPLSRIDPTGLAECTMDGADAPCDMVFATIGRGAVTCPNNDCAPQYNKGQWQYFGASADGSSGYLPMSLAGSSTLDVANALSIVTTAASKLGKPVDPASLTGGGASAWNLLKALGVSIGDITIYQNDGGDFEAVLSAQGFASLMSGLQSNLGDAFLHYPYTDGARDFNPTDSLHAVWFDPNVTNYVGGSGIYMQFHTDADNPSSGSMWGHMMCVLFNAGCGQ